MNADFKFLGCTVEIPCLSAELENSNLSVIDSLNKSEYFCQYQLKITDEENSWT
jgi:hypothetical protein